MPPPANLKSLLAKLRNEGRKRGLPANLMLLFYFQERFLARAPIPTQIPRNLTRSEVPSFRSRWAVVRPLYARISVQR